MENKKMKMKKVLSIILISSLLLSLTACGKNNSNSSGESKAANSLGATDEATAADAENSNVLDSVTMLVNYKATEVPAADNPLVVKINEYTGTQLDVQWVPQDSFSEKINALMASNGLPEITVIREIKQAGFVNAARAGMFWDLTPYISKYNNLSQIDETIMKNVQTDGKQYLIPRIRDKARMGGIIRTDWLENVGMEMPTTLDELYAVLTAFKNDDPDGNGVDDTIGLSMNNTELENDATLLSVYMGGPATWLVDADGNLKSEYETDTYTEALTWFRNAYKDGLINEDFAINQDELTNFTSGRAGMMWLGNVEDANTRMSDLQAINPNATVDIFQNLTAEAGGEPHIVGYQGYSGAIAISKTAVKDEERLLLILDFLNKLGDPDMSDLFNWGVEGDSYTLEDGQVVQTSEQETIYAEKYNQLRQITPFYTFRNLEAKTMTPMGIKIKESMAENVQYTVDNPALPFISETEVELGDLVTFIQDSATKYVIDGLDLDGWNAAVTDWKDRGGNEITQEYSELYKATK